MSIPFALLRVVIVTHTIALIAQSSLAGEFLSGTDGVVKFHEGIAWVTLAICLVQLILAAITLRSGDSSLWMVIGSILLFLAEGLQTGTGYGRFLRVHIPLGVLVFGVVLAQTIAVFRPGSKK